MTSSESPSLRCPPIDALESFASGAELSPDVRTHVSSCDSCKGAVESIRTNNELLAEFASANHQSNVLPQQFGHYEILGLLGAGGMGEVYRARDTRLDRDVALKMLPAVFAHDPERIARFRREATILASLNHPHIAAVYGYEQSEDLQFLLLELVEGETLAERLACGPLPVKEAITICRQIAEALEAAHARGVIHRDLKPANVKITPQGQVKVLDFGLAKAFAQETANPKLDSETELTAVYTPRGIIIGTAAYMSPEQARTQPLDRQTDIWSFGCLLYECLTGCRPFTGETTSDLIARILERNPDESFLPTTTPPSLRRLLRRCLEKDRGKRLRDIGDAILELDAIDDTTLPVQVPAASPTTRRWKHALAGAVVALLVTLPAWLWNTITLQSNRDSRVLCSNIVAPPGTSFFSTSDFAGPPVLSPDGKSIAFVTTREAGLGVLCVRRLDAEETRILPGTEKPFFPFWSPDSQSVGFFADGKLKRIEVAGGNPVPLCKIDEPRGGTWGPQDIILFAKSFDSAIYSIQASLPGVPESVTELDETRHTTHRWPTFLPGGTHFLYLAANRDASKSEHNAVYWASLDGKENRMLFRSNANVDFASPYLLFMQDKTLKAQRFDPVHGQLLGSSMALFDGILYDPTTFYAVFDGSSNDVLLFQRGDVLSRLIIVDRESWETRPIGDPDLFYGLRLSPNFKSVAVNCGDPSDIWVYDVLRDVRQRITTDPLASDVGPIWSNDGKWIVYTSLDRPDRKPKMFRTPADGGGSSELIKEFPMNIWATDITADNRYLIYDQVDGLDGPRDLNIMPLIGSSQSLPYFQTPYLERDGQFSPNGRWIAFTSRESGEDEVYVAPFPMMTDDNSISPADRPRGRWPISREGGNRPRWRSDGKELFFLAPNNHLMAAEVDSEKSEFRVISIRPLFQTRAKHEIYSYDVFPDGKSFIINSISERAHEPITLIQNWQARLKSK